ncbi:unnamed protein product [Ranitomeya imitator]|uniref:DUF4709 domain-containing protein n=1 Tax=Ranitomeya imitator TaxID=111125 RepID=A0ABN9KXL4_9NEOB|nr:unnamed protein product [Ranitomeya imitator]
MENRGSSETAALPGALDDDLSVEAYVREIEFRRAISNQLRVGLYESDRSTQTDESEVVEIKELTSVVQSLTQKVSTLRKSFQQQLIDALAVIRSKYEKHYNANSDLLKSVDSQADSAKIQELRRKIIEKDLVIQSLEAQISEMVESEQPKQTWKSSQPGMSSRVGPFHTDSNFTKMDIDS